MWVSHEELQEAANMALDNPEIMDMMSKWNNTSDYGEQDMLLCQIMNLVKAKKEEALSLLDDCSNECGECDCE